MKSKWNALRWVLVLAACLMAVGCASTPPAMPPEELFRDPALVQLDSMARKALAGGEAARAARLYGLVLQRARVMDMSEEVAKAAYNQGACLLIDGRPEEARSALREAASEWDRQGEDAAPAWVLEAKAAHMLGDKAGARQLIDRVVEANTAQGGQAQAWILYGQWGCEERDAAEAGKALARARQLMGDDPSLRAGVASLEGQLALVEGRAAEAVRGFDLEASWLRHAERFDAMAVALQRGGAACAQAGDARGAAQRYFRAARSFYGQRALVPALRAVELAVEQAARAEDDALGASVAGLLEEIKRDVALQAAMAVVEPVE